MDPIITLTTDFGTKDWFVGTIKGVILGIAPRATIVDITHEIPAGDIRAGSTKRVGFAVGDGSLAVTCVHKLTAIRS